jgi:hypothetical protein
MVWPLTVIRGMGKCATLHTTLPQIRTIFFLLLTHVATLLWPPPFRAPNLLSYPPDPDYRTHRTTRDKAPPKGRHFLPPPLEVLKWGMAVTQGLVRPTPVYP